MGISRETAARGALGAAAESAAEDALAPLREILNKYGKIPGSLITVLQRTQEVYGYISEEAIKLISRSMGISCAKIYGVVTFYSQFRLEAAGKYTVIICKGTACHVNGADALCRAVEEYLGISDGQTTPDGLFTLSTAACLGCCSLAPVMMIREDKGEETYGRLSEDKAVEILRGYREKSARGGEE